MPRPGSTKHEGFEKNNLQHASPNRCPQDAPKMSPRCPQDVPKMSPRCPQHFKMSPRFPQDVPSISSSPLTFDVSKVASTRFQVQSDFYIFYVLENDGRTNCKMLSNKGFQWRHKCAKCGQIAKRSMKIKGPNNLRMEMTKQGETQGSKA